MRFADIVLRQGHLSDRGIADAVLSGNRPAHLERCDVCAARAVDLGRWLDETRALGLEAADAAFPADHLATQHAQILHRLAQLDEPARVISFPRASRQDDRASGGRRVAASWVTVAAAAGLVVGVVGGQISARLAAPAPSDAATVTAESPATPTGRAIDASILLDDDRQPVIGLLDPLGEITTPRTVQARAGG